MKLGDGLNDPNKKEKVVADCLKLIDELVATAKGITGLGLKAAYTTVKGVAPGYYAGAIGRLLPEAFAALDPIWSQGIETGDPVEYLSQNRTRTADALLSVTDARIQKKSGGVVRGTYEKLRNSAKEHVEKAVPGLAGIINDYTSA